MDIDLEDLDTQSKAPAAKPGRFAPKNSKFKPVAKPKREPEALVPSSESIPAAVPKVELDDSKPLQPPPVAAVNSSIEIEQPSHTVVPPSHDGNGSVKMDTDVTDMEVDNDQHQNGEDQVVREIDVFFKSSSDANSKLYVLQYPLRQCWRPYELDDRCEKVRVKPESAEVEIELSVKKDSENYDAGVDDDKAMQKQVLATAWKPLSAAGHAVGILIGNQLHINPVHAVVQLRPSMEHLRRDPPKEDIKNEKIKQSNKQLASQSKPPGAVNEQDEVPKEWITLEYQGETTQLSHAYMKKLVAEQTSQIQFAMTPSDYIDSICPPSTSDKGKPKVLSRSSLLKLPLEERFKTQLVEGPPLNRFNVLKHIAPNENEEDIFKVLHTHAHLVQGFWVAKSRLKYNKDSGKEVLLRNYVLLQFSKNPNFHENQLPKQTTLSDTTKVILDELSARRDSCRDWKFNEIPDDSFIKQYPDIVEEQRKIWDRAEPQIMDALFPKSSKHGFGDRRPTLNTTNVVAPKATNAPPVKTGTIDETSEALPKALQKLFVTYKVCSFNEICRNLHAMALSDNRNPKGSQEARALAAAANAPLEEIQKTLTQVAVNIHGSFVSKSSPDHPEFDELRNVVINLLLAEGPNARLKKASIYAAAKVQLKRDITNSEYQKVLNELCVSQNSAWVLKSADGVP